MQDAIQQGFKSQKQAMLVQWVKCNAISAIKSELFLFNIVFMVYIIVLDHYRSIYRG